MSYETLNTEGFLFTNTTLALALVKANFGDGYGASALVGSADGVRSWTIKIDVLPDSVDQGAPLVEGRTRSEYLWNFFLTSKTSANKVFWLADPKDGAFYLAEFADDNLSFEILCAKVYGTGLQLHQRRVAGVNSPVFVLPGDLINFALATAGSTITSTSSAT